MENLIIWLGLVCCSVANGLIYSGMTSFRRYVLMLLIILLAALFIQIYYRFTKDLKDKEHTEYEEYRIPIFTKSALLAISVLIVASIFGWAGVIVSSITAMLSFIVALCREMEYI